MSHFAFNCNFVNIFMRKNENSIQPVFPQLLSFYCVFADKFISKEAKV